MAYLRWLVVLLFTIPGIGFAQSVSSSLNGELLDATAGGVPGATCKLTNQETGAALTAASDANGLFTFPSVTAGLYGLDVQANGFKSLHLSNIVVIASERRALGNLTPDKSGFWSLFFDAASAHCPTFAQGRVLGILAVGPG